jgi:hypothetical protein
VSAQVTYYAIVWSGQRPDEAMGLARRRVTDRGFTDESLLRDLTWDHTTVIVDWNRGEIGRDLIEISEEEANRIIERFRTTWSSGD